MAGWISYHSAGRLNFHHRLFDFAPPERVYRRRNAESVEVQLLANGPPTAGLDY